MPAKEFEILTATKKFVYHETTNGISLFMKKNFFEWLVECCRLLGKDKLYGAILIEDPSWASAWDDGLTEEDAIKEFKKEYPDGYSKEIEQKYLIRV